MLPLSLVLALLFVDSIVSDVPVPVAVSAARTAPGRVRLFAVAGGACTETLDVADDQREDAARTLTDLAATCAAQAVPPARVDLLAAWLASRTPHPGVGIALGITNFVLAGAALFAPRAFDPDPPLTVSPLRTVLPLEAVMFAATGAFDVLAPESRWLGALNTAAILIAVGATNMAMFSDMLDGPGLAALGIGFGGMAIGLLAQELLWPSRLATDDAADLALVDTAAKRRGLSPEAIDDLVARAFPTRSLGARLLPFAPFVLGAVIAIIGEQQTGADPVALLLLSMGVLPYLSMADAPVDREQFDKGLLPFGWHVSVGPGGVGVIAKM